MQRPCSCSILAFWMLSSPPCTQVCHVVLLMREIMVSFVSQYPCDMVPCMLIPAIVH